MISGPAAQLNAWSVRRTSARMKTDVVLLPGLHGSTELFHGFTALAPPWSRCRPIPLPEQPDQSFDALAKSLSKELESLEGFVLFAESFSGPVAARIAQQLGAKVSLLVICNPLVEVGLAVHPRFAASMLQSSFVPSWAVAFAMTGGDRTLARAVIREVRKLPRATLAGRLAAASFARREDLLSFLAAPLLAITGKLDRLVNPRTIEELISQVPFAIHREVAAPHLAAQVAATQVWAAIADEYETAA
jgi:pimeloyl-[acyl-carrier protein] methyl ester esterase